MKIRYEGLEDQVAKSVFQDLERDLVTISQLEGFRLVRITFLSAVTNFAYPHGLGFKPLDLIQTSLTGGGAITWHYDRFDKSFLYLTTTGPCVVRAFVGTYLGDNQ